MRTCFRFRRATFACLAGLCVGAAAGQAPHPRPLLPPAIYAVPGLTTAVLFDNVIVAQEPGHYRFQAECAIGQVHADRWEVTPGPGDVGAHRLTLTVTGPEDEPYGSVQTDVIVVPAEAGQGGTVSILLVGDSLTAARHYPAELARLLDLPGNPEGTLCGRNRRGNIRHEGYGGWTWSRFASQYAEDEDGNRLRGKEGASPFVYRSSGPEPAMDIARFVREECEGVPPRVVVFLLGTNDAFLARPGAPDGDERSVASVIDRMLGHADAVLHAWKNAYPDVVLAVCLTPPGNQREEGFYASYQGRYTRWGWKQIQHSLVARMIEQYGGREHEGIALVPTHLVIDPVGGYPENNGVHPNPHGYAQIAQQVYAWLKSRLAL